MKVETPNQIAAWMSPPKIASKGVAIVPPAAKTIPKIKPISAQNLGFEVFITHRVRGRSVRFKDLQANSCPFLVRLAKNNG